MPSNSSLIVRQLTSARGVSTPLCTIRTADPSGTIESLRYAELWHPNGKQDGAAPLLSWDCVCGLRAIERPGDASKPSERALMLALGDAEPASSVNTVEALTMIRKAPPGTIVFMLNAHRLINEDPSISQAIWNLRDIFKADMRMLVMLCPTISLPAELQQDVLILDEPLPSDAELRGIAQKLYQEVGLAAPDEPALSKIVDATLGLAAFPAEQAMAMSLTRKGVKIDELWDRKRSIIDASPGLMVWRGGETFNDIGGCDNIKTFLRDVIVGVDPPRCILFVDELEKHIGSGTDTSGVSQALLGKLLTWMQDNSATGCLFIGPPGAAKSAVAKAAGNEAGIPTIAMDLSGMKNSLVGASEERFANALKIVDAVSQQRCLVVATCNSLAVLPPELRRRFGFGIYFFSLPDAEERTKIWELYSKKFGVSGPRPRDDGWTGAEIRQCADIARRLRISLEKAATYVVPVSKSAAEQLDRLCREAHGKYISANYEGVYQYDKLVAAPPASGRRIVTFAGEGDIQ